MLPTEPFGRTGHASTRVVFGAAALARASQERADEVLETLLRHGVNHLDTAADYGDAELRMAPWLARHPGRFFVATKTARRAGDEARRSLERSLERLGVDRVDLIQLHNLVEEDEWATATSPRGAVEALVKARDEGLVRHIGVTGHGLRIAAMHLRGLERFDFDSVLLPYSHVLLADEGYRGTVERLLSVCEERRVAVQTIKSVARRRWSDPAAPHHSWYEPMADEGVITRTVNHVLANPQLFLVSSSDWLLLEPVLRAATALTGPPSDEELRDDVEREELRPIFDGAALERI